MRLLQLRTDGSSLVDLHPNLTVVRGLDEAARNQLLQAIEGLAAGVARGEGLMEAHGVLFDLSTEMLALLDVASGDRSPVVVAEDLPSLPDDPQVRARAAAQRALAEATQRWQTSADERERAMAEVDAARSRLDELESQLLIAEADVSGRLDSVDERTTALDHALEHRRRLAEELEALARDVDAATADLSEIEASTSSVRAASDEAVARAAALASQLERAEALLSPGSEDLVVEAVAELERLEAEAAADERAARAAIEAEPAPGPTPAEELERLQGRLDEVDKRLAGGEVHAADAVQAEIERVRGLPEVVLVPSPEAEDLAAQIEALPSHDDESSSEPLDPAGARARLDDARQALLEAEQAARNPPLDRELVDRLEGVHAELLDALDRVGGRFGGGRARRQAEQLREDEQALLDQMGFGSYSDYMMGSSVRPVDRDQSAALDAARATLAAAEDEWRALQARTEAELGRAEALDRRRALLDRAQDLLGRTVGARAVVAELRALRVEAAPTGDPTAPLRAALEQVGLELGAGDLSRPDLLLVAEAWVEEVAVDRQRLAELDEERRALQDARTALVAQLEAAQAVAASDAPDARVARVAAARQALAEAERLVEDHRRALVEVARLRHELDDAAAAERAALAEAAEAEAAVAGARREADRLSSRLAGAEAALAAAMQAEAEAERLLADHEGVTGPEQVEALRAKVAEVADALELRVSAAEQAVEATTRHEEERQQAAAALEALQDEADPDAVEPSMAEEIEWHLLARLAAQRSVSLAGSVPLLLDDALAAVAEPDLGRILGRLERMADAVQVILVTDDDSAASWASLAGPTRAAVVTVQPV